jgi:O-antigen/teichoic acid export membrane protein
LLKVRVLAQRLRTDRIVANNAVFLLGSVGAGVFGYVFHFVVGHLLGPAAYSIVAAGISALYLLTLPALILQIVSMRFTTLSSARSDPGSIRQLLARISTISLAVGAALALSLLLFRQPVAHYLQLSDERVVIVLAFSTVLGLLVAANRGVLQGMRRFAALSINMMIDTASRVAAGVALIALGFGALGALTAVLVGPALAYGQSLFLLRGLRRSPGRATISYRDLGLYAGPAALAVIGVTYMFNIDVILAKHYLAPDAAGIYAAAAVLARVVYFLGLTVTGVMFPEVATLHARDQSHFHVVDLSLLLLGGVGAALIGSYVIFPGLVILPFGSGFAPVIPYLGPFAVALTLLALSNLLVNYFLSVNSLRFVVPLLAACLLETGLIGAFLDGVGRILAMVTLTMAALGLSLGVLYAWDRLRGR